MRRVFFLVALLTLAATLEALDLSSGRMRLGLYADTGRFSLAYKSSSGEYIPLFYAQDPRTSVLILRVGDRFYRMGDSHDFRISVEKTASGGTIAWTSPQLTVKEEFTFATAVGASEADGVRIDVVISNTSSAPLTVGARMLIDTYLGEQSRIHFMTDSGATISSEAEFLAAKMPAYWLSPKDAQKSIALECVTKGEGVTTPDRIVFANWKRLNDTDWEFTAEPGRAFNLLPYSINDSAVAMYYDPAPLAAGASRTINMLLGEYAPEGWPGTAPSSSVSTSLSRLLSAASAPAQEGAPAQSGAPSQAQATTLPGNRASVQSDLKVVQETLGQIDGLLSGRAQATQSDIELLKKVLDKLNNRKNNYSSK